MLQFEKKKSVKLTIIICVFNIHPVNEIGLEYVLPVHSDVLAQDVI